MSESVDLVLSVIATLTAIISIFLSYGRASKKDAVDLEHRLTLVEQNQFKESDRRCLQDLDVKMGLIWQTVKEDFPALLKQMTAPKIDDLLDKAQRSIKLLTEKEADQLQSYLSKKVEDAKRNEQPGYAVIAALYRAVLKYELGGKPEKNADKH